MPYDQNAKHILGTGKKEGPLQRDPHRLTQIGIRINPTI